MKSSGILMAFFVVAGNCFLNTIVKGIPLNNTQTNLLTDIAFQCPYEGGTAVFDARALLDGLTNDVFDDEVLCATGGQQGLMLPPMGNTTSLPGVQVYPNPAKGQLTIQLDQALETSLEVRLLNLYGQTMTSAQLPEQVRTQVLDLPEMPSGIYWLVIYSGDGQKEVKRVVINR
jgi:type IX secretion system substrate protein